MHSLSPPDHDINLTDRSADRTSVLEHRSSTFAAEAARSAFGRRYPAEGHDGFVDRAPGELALIRAARGLAT